MQPTLLSSVLGGPLVSDLLRLPTNSRTVLRPGCRIFPGVVFTITSSLADIANSTAYHLSSLYSQVQIVIRLAGTGAARGHGDVVHAAHPNDDPCTRTVFSPRFMAWNEIGIFSQSLFRPVQVPYVL